VHRALSHQATPWPNDPAGLRGQALRGPGIVSAEHSKPLDRPDHQAAALQKAPQTEKTHRPNQASHRARAPWRSGNPGDKRATRKGIPKRGGEASEGHPLQSRDRSTEPTPSAGLKGDDQDAALNLVAAQDDAAAAASRACDQGSNRSPHGLGWSLSGRPLQTKPRGQRPRPEAAVGGMERDGAGDHPKGQAAAAAGAKNG